MGLWFEDPMRWDVQEVMDGSVMKRQFRSKMREHQTSWMGRWDVEDIEDIMDGSVIGRP